MARYCMTYNAASGDSAIATCMFSCPAKGYLLDTKTAFHPLPYNSSSLDETMCGKQNHQGFLCSEYRPGYKPPAYSYSLECVKCNLSHKQLALNWLGYLTLAVLPQSIRFLLIFQILCWYYSEKK